MTWVTRSSFDSNVPCTLVQLTLAFGFGFLLVCAKVNGCGLVVFSLEIVLSTMIWMCATGQKIKTFTQVDKVHPYNSRNNTQKKKTGFDRRRLRSKFAPAQRPIRWKSCVLHDDTVAFQTSCADAHGGEKEFLVRKQNRQIFSEMGVQEMNAGGDVFWQTLMQTIYIIRSVLILIFSNSRVPHRNGCKHKSSSSSRHPTCFSAHLIIALWTMRKIYWNEVESASNKQRQVFLKMLNCIRLDYVCRCLNISRS